MSELFQIIHPSLILAPYIRYYWLLRSDIASEQRIIPSGCMQMVFHRGTLPIINDSTEQYQVFIGGQSTSYSDIQTSHGLDMIVAVLEPFGAKAFFKIPMNELDTNDISLYNIDSRGYSELRNRLEETTNNTTAIAYIEQYLIDKLHNLHDYNTERMKYVIKNISINPNLSLTSLSSLACLSSKQFSRIFSEHIGITPKQYSKIIRLQKALHLMQTSQIYSFTQLAYECGYYDQAHLIREFKVMTGYTPKQYIKIGNPYSDFYTDI